MPWIPLKGVFDLFSHCQKLFHPAAAAAAAALAPDRTLWAIGNESLDQSCSVTPVLVKPWKCSRTLILFPERKTVGIVSHVLGLGFEPQ